MRFERLHLQAFGPFTDETLDLSGGAPGGLHVIYGANEAGKSTSLRAVTAFLFGFPHRTTDAHVHPQNRLSVGAEVSDAERRYPLVRLKRRKDDLVDASGVPVEENPLPSLLAHLDERSFTSRFGLDQIELERGAEALLGGSEQGLFAAGTAGSQVRKVLDELEKETSDIFLPRGKVPRLNRALVEFEQASREARRAERPPEKWMEQKRAHEQAREKVAQLRRQRSEMKNELRRLNRLRSVIKDLQDWEAVRSRRMELGDEPRLPEDVTDIRLRAERQLQEAATEARRIQMEIRAFEEDISALPPESPIVDVDDEQLQLSTRVGTALSARKDLPKRQASLLEQVRQIRQLLSDLGQAPPAGEELAWARRKMISAKASSAVRRLMAEHGALEKTVESARSQLERQTLEIARLQSEQPDVRSVEHLQELEAALSAAQAERGVLSRIEELVQQRDALRATSARLRAELGSVKPWRDVASTLPSKAGARTFVQGTQKLQSQLEKIAADLSRSREERARLSDKLAQEERGDLPSLERLQGARLARDEALSEIERAAEEGKPAPVATTRHLRQLARNADELSDRLRVEADRVASVAALTREMGALDRRREDLEAMRDEARTALAKLGASFQERLDALGVEKAVDPSEAEDVFDSVRRLSEVEQEVEAVEQSLTRGRERISQAASRLSAHLSLDPRPGEQGLPSLNEPRSLNELMGLATLEAKEAVAALSRKRQREETLTRLHLAQEEAEGQLERAEAQLAVWRQRWAEAMRQLDLPAETEPLAAEETLGIFEKMARVVDVADNLEGRIAGMKRDTDALARDVRAVLRRHLPDLLDLDPVDAAVELQEAVRAARKVADERARSRRLISERRAALAHAQARQAAAEAQLRQLVEMAGVAAISDLPGAEERRREIRSLETERLSLEKSIRDASEGATLEQLKDEAAGWRGRGELIAKIGDLEDAAQELEEDLRAAESDEAGTELGLQTYRSVDVVQARQRAVLKGSEATDALRQYLVLKTAQNMLQAQIENYAERFAGPIASRASDLFERITLGRYSSLRVGVGEKTLRCVRDGAEVEVDQLSRGTRAQLYFALRLASLEAYFRDQPAVPLVFDDLFVDFDDDRTTAAFEILSEVARSVQVLYFTHLARDVEAAHDAVPRGVLFEHRLGVS